MTPRTTVCQAPRYMGFSQQEYWSGLPFHSLGDLPYPGIELASPASPVLASEFFTTDTTWVIMFLDLLASLEILAKTGFRILP